MESGKKNEMGLLKKMPGIKCLIFDVLVINQTDKISSYLNQMYQCINVSVWMLYLLSSPRNCWVLSLVTDPSERRPAP